jgi:murein DD-endopeptidase MepM/ murein hydrolase activator NlpD
MGGGTQGRRLVRAGSWGLLLLFIMSLHVACVRVYTAYGFYHRVQPGDSLASISRGSGTSIQDIAEMNNIEDPSMLRPGSRIFVPKARKSLFSRRKSRKSRKNPQVTAARSTPTSETVKSTPEKKSSSSIVLDRGRFHWPLRGPISSKFGLRKGRPHEGIDIRAKKGAPIRAAASGTVVFSGRLRGYGQMLLIKHQDEFFTAYAHNSKNLTHKGKHVKRGEIIARVGNTGRTTGPHLHFEVRKGRKARNPLFFLPKT